MSDHKKVKFYEDLAKAYGLYDKGDLMKYNCAKCGAGCCSADETKTLCNECQTDEKIAKMKSPEEIKERRGQIKIDIEKRMDNWQAIAYEGGFRDALDWVLGVDE